MNRKISLTLIVSLLAPVSFVHAASSSFTNPFGVATQVQAPVPSAKQQAIAALPLPARRKVEAVFLDRLMDQESNDLIVEYVSKAPISASSSTDHAAKLRARKIEFKISNNVSTRVLLRVIW